MEETKIAPTNRYCVLVAGMILQLCAGIIYMWSVFRQPVAEHLNWELSAASLTSSIMLAMFVLGIIFGGYAQDRLGPRKAAPAGSILIGLGMVLTSLVTNKTPWLVYITYGVIGGLGVGTVYMSAIAAVQKWFPDRRGFASGMVVSAFGFSLVVFAPLARTMLSNLGVPDTFLIFGTGFFVICIICSIFLTNPPAGHLPKGYVSPNTVSAKRQYSPKEVLKTKQFYLLAGSLVFTLPAYFMLNPIFLSLGAQRGLSEQLAVLGVMITGISSASGRLVVSWVSDKTGRKAAMIGIAVIMLASSFVMIAAKGFLFLICIVLISFGFGGASGVYSAMTAESFGTKFGGMNFGLVMLGFGISALVAQMVSNRLVAGGSYTSSFIVAAVTCVIAIVLILLMKDPGKNTEL